MSIELVVCGLEHSGTTLISELFRQVEGLDSGFEVGVLLCENPSDFERLQPFSTHLLQGWGITSDQLATCCAKKSYSDFYAELYRQSTVLAEGTERIFDKTPRYLSVLDACLQRTDAPFIASFKDPRAIVHSDFKRSGEKDFARWYADYLPSKLQYMSSCYDQYLAHRSSDRVVFVGLEHLALDARRTMERMFSHVGQAFDLDYVLLSGVRYNNTRSNAVSIPIAFAYLADFSREQIALIEKDFGQLNDWFYR